MKLSEELEIDAHILAASNLKITSIGYKALVSLLKYGNFMSYAFRDYDIFVNFTRMLNHLQVEIEFVPFGLQLKENAKLNYRNNMMTLKHQKLINQTPTQHKESSSRIGKQDPDDGKLGWAERKMNNRQ